MKRRSSRSWAHARSVAVAAIALAACGNGGVWPDGDASAQVPATPSASPAAPPLELAQKVPSLTPAELRPLLGPLVLRNAGPAETTIRAYDSRYESTEAARFGDFLAVEEDRRGAYLDGNHYGGLRSRLMWAIRNAEPWGPGHSDDLTTGYGRGVRIVRRYLRYTVANRHVVPVQHNTSLADVELLYRLEGDTVALTHIQIVAASFTSDPYNYVKVRNPKSGVRIPAVALQAFNAAHRLKVPYARNPANPNVVPDAALGSWKAAGDRLIQWIDQYQIVKPDGSTFSPSNNGDTYFMDAMLAVQLLQWCANVEWNPRAFEIAQLIMDHLIASVKPGQQVLGYQDTSRDAAPDLAAFYVWPSLVLWQETGEPRYREFALTNLAATRKAYIQGIKQWNQVYSTLAQGAEALLAGVPWRE